MRIVVAPDKYKGSLSSVEAAAAMAEGIKLIYPDAQVDLCPMADGGEGTVEAIAQATGAEIRERRVRGPLDGQEVLAAWAFLDEGKAANLNGQPGSSGPLGVVEMAQASGYSLVPEGSRDPMATTTYGTGELMLEALDAGCSSMIVGIGGSATVDGGTGMAIALGYRFLDAEGRELPGVGGSLRDIRTIDASAVDGRIERTRIVVASDVTSPLVGPRGAAAVFGPQKGASAEQVAELDAGLANLGALMRDQLGKDVMEMQGAGAAGGLGAGLMAFCGASVASGVDLVAGACGLPTLVEGADLVLTGEGSYDSQTSSGKTPAGVAAIARDAGVPAIIVAGRIEGDPLQGPAPVFCVVPGPSSLAEAISQARTNVVAGTARLMRLLAVELEG